MCRQGLLTLDSLLQENSTGGLCREREVVGVRVLVCRVDGFRERVNDQGQKTKAGG